MIEAEELAAHDIEGIEEGHHGLARIKLGLVAVRP